MSASKSSTVWEQAIGNITVDLMPILQKRKNSLPHCIGENPYVNFWWLLMSLTICSWFEIVKVWVCTSAQSNNNVKCRGTEENEVRKIENCTPS
jgi:hypothetical protein